MDLEGTELVTLSACGTGEGALQVGNAVYALRRAFTLAGAKNLLMGLWAAGDERTARQVKAFYRKWPALPPAEALREAQLETIRDLRAESGGQAPPSLWAAFILQGAHALSR